MKYSLIFAALLTGTAVCRATSPVGPGAEAYMERGAAMYETYNYTGAIDQLSRYLGISPASMTDGEPRARATVMLMRATLRHGDYLRTGELYRQFAAEYSGSPLMKEAMALQADALFYRGDYPAAVGIYEGLEIGALPAAEQAATRFRYGVALTRCGYFDRAAAEFARLADDPEHAGKAAFYLAYLDYVQYKYEQALNAFRALDADVARDMGADFYIAQILYAGGMYSQVTAMTRNLEQAAARIESDGLAAGAETQRLLGESWYALGDRQKARAYLDNHLRMSGDKAARSARYIRGMMAFDEGDGELTRSLMEAVSDGDDNLAQSASLYLGQTAMRAKDYTAAAMHFDRAARMTADREVAETALYNYAAATTSGGRVPFGSASLLLEDFGSRYPNSKYAPAVNEYLASGYMAERRYDRALARLERIKNPDRNVRKMMQTALYEIAINEINSGKTRDLAHAEEQLRKAIGINADKELTAQCQLWLGDALYGQQRYGAAANAYKAYLHDAARNDANRGLALYNQAYALFQKKDYKAARALFAEAAALTGTGRLNKSLHTDALLRQADCDNYNGNVAGALALYESAAADGGSGADYAAFQAACMQGVKGNQALKASQLESMLNRWPQSDWAPSALYELSQAYLAQGNIDAALKAQERLAAIHSDSELLRESRLSLAAAYSTAGETDKAISECKDIIRRWPTSKQAATASEYLQSLYSRKGQMNEYVAFIRSVPGAPQPKTDELDRMTYFAAVEMLDDKPEDDRLLKEYVASFPDGAYVADAWLALAGIYTQTRNSDKALEMLDNILKHRPDSDTAVEAMMAKADILRARGNRAEAEQLYKSVLKRAGNEYATRAYYGLIHCSPDDASLKAYIDRYLALPGVTDAERAEVLRIKGMVLMDTGDYTGAEALFKELAADMYSAEGAEAAVYLAQMYLKQNKPKQAVELMNRFTSGGCEDSYWLARGYITLADAYAASGNRNTARQYIKALLDNYPEANTEILKLIEDRLKKY